LIFFRSENGRSGYHAEETVKHPMAGGKIFRRRFANENPPGMLEGIHRPVTQMIAEGIGSELSEEIGRISFPGKSYHAKIDIGSDEKLEQLGGPPPSCLVSIQ
jgi:hypothetical protein